MDCGTRELSDSSFNAYILALTFNKIKSINYFFEKINFFNFLNYNEYFMVWSVVSIFFRFDVMLYCLFKYTAFIFFFYTFCLKLNRVLFK